MHSLVFASLSLVHTSQEEVPNLEIPATSVQPEREVRRLVLQNLVVHVDILAEQRFVVNPRLLHADNHRVGTEERERRVVELDVATPELVESGELLTVDADEVRKVFLCVASTVRLLYGAQQKRDAHHQSCTQTCRMYTPCRGAGASMSVRKQ